MDLGLGDICDSADEAVNSVKDKAVFKSLFEPKICDIQWFADDAQCQDEDDIKFKADHHFYMKQYDKALDLFISLLQGERYGSSRSLMAEIFESITICYRKLGQYETAKLFCVKSDQTAKSADQRSTNLYVKSRILQEFGDRVELLDCMKRLLLLHPYNHYLWLEFSLLHSEFPKRVLYLLRTRLLLEINLRTVQSVIKDKHVETINQVDQMLTRLQCEVDSGDFARMREMIKKRDVSERYQEEWQSEEYRIQILDQSPGEVSDVFHAKWDVMLDEIG